MTVLNVLRLSAVFATSLALSGCFVTTQQMPAGTGPINDDALVGKWQGIDAEDNKPENTFFTITKTGRDAPLHMVMLDDGKQSEYDIRTTQVNGQHILVARVTAPEEAIKESGGGSYIAYYEAMPEQLTFYLLDAEKVRPLVKSGKLKGNPGEKQYDIVELTGSAQDVAAFLGSKDGLASRVDGPGGRMIRVH